MGYTSKYAKQMLGSEKPKPKVTYTSKKAVGKAVDVNNQKNEALNQKIKKMNKNNPNNPLY